MARIREFLEPDKSSDRSEKLLEQFNDRLDVIRNRAELLTGRNRELIEIYLNNRITFRQLAKIIGVNEVSIARKIHGLIQRLLDGRYITCLRHRKELTDQQLEIARDYLIDGLSMNEIAIKHEISTYAVKKTLIKIQLLTKKKQKQII